MEFNGTEDRAIVTDKSLAQEGDYVMTGKSILLLTSSGFTEVFGVEATLALINKSFNLGLEYSGGSIVASPKVIDTVADLGNGIYRVAPNHTIQGVPHVTDMLLVHILGVKIIITPNNGYYVPSTVDDSWINIGYKIQSNDSSYGGLMDYLNRTGNPILPHESIKYNVVNKEVDLNGKDASKIMLVYDPNSSVEVVWSTIDPHKIRVDTVSSNVIVMYHAN